jgi:hypothetical protein
VIHNRYPIPDDLRQHGAFCFIGISFCALRAQKEIQKEEVPL